MKALWDSIPTRTLALLLAAAVGWLSSDYFGMKAVVRDMARSVGQIEGRVTGWDATDRTLLFQIDQMGLRIDNHLSDH